MTIRKFDRITILTQASYASPYGKLNCIAELHTSFHGLRDSFPGVKGLGRKVDCFPLCSAEIKNE
jgi:hypothetical protein